MSQNDGGRVGVVARVDLDVQFRAVVGTQPVRLPPHRTERLVLVGVRPPRLTHRELFGRDTGYEPRRQCDETALHRSSPTYTRGTRGPRRVTIS